MEVLLDYIIDLKNRGIFMEALDGQLKVTGEIARLTAEDKSRIREEKQHLITLLKNSRGNEAPKFSRLSAAPVAQDYPLSASQRRLWILSRLEQANVGYNIPGAFVFRGVLNEQALTTAFMRLIQRHEILRTVFRERSGEVRQVILDDPESRFAFKQVDLRHMESRHEMLPRELSVDAATPFDLEQGPLVKATLYRLEENVWVFSYVMHHIISDGWSMEILIKELLTLYNALSEGKADTLPLLPLQYKDFSVWQQQQFSGAALKKEKEYWLDQFKDEAPDIDLPAIKARPSVKTYTGAICQQTLPRELQAALNALAKQTGSTLFMVLLAGVNVLLHRYTAQQDIVIGTPAAGRDHVDLEDQIGFYVNTLALRMRFNAGDSFYQLLTYAKKCCIDAFENQHYPFDALVEVLQLQRNMGRNPLFDIQVIVQDQEGEKTVKTLNGLEVTTYDGWSRQTSVFDMVFNFVNADEGLKLTVTYSDMYSREMVQLLITHLQQLLQEALQWPEEPVGMLKMLQDAEQDRLLTQSRGPVLSYPAMTTLVSLFREQAARTPEAPAVFYGGRTVSYQELDCQSARLAACLKEDYSVRPGDCVGIMLPRDEQAVLAILGILKAGAAYVPVDPGYPAARKEYMLVDAGVKVLLTQTTFMFDVPAYQGSMLALDVQTEYLDVPADKERTLTAADELAYVIYTSGSTGHPKGVMVEHRAAVNTVLAQRVLFGATQGQRHLQFASLSFDASVSEIFVALSSGSCLCIIPDELKMNPVQLEGYLKAQTIELATLPPTYVKLLGGETLKSLKRLVTAGETADPGVARSFSRQGVYYNAYGPTEAGICGTVFKLEGQQTDVDKVPIGRPIFNARVYILDGQGQLIPQGLEGEICIGGAGLARGYLNQPELTAAKFVTDPFVPGARMYRTGDRGCWLPDGNILFLGRMDEQVKIRGHRVEPGETEQVLQRYKEITSVAVIPVKGSSGETELVAYITSEVPPDVPALYTFLRERLPAYMVPAQFIRLDTLPVTTSGKIDRKKLAGPQGIRLQQQEYAAPQNDRQKALIAACEDVLKRQPIGLKDDFFLLGGDSIKSIQVVARLKQKGYMLTIQDVLQQPVMENLARCMTAVSRHIDQTAVEGVVPLSPIQMFFLEGDTPDKHHYNQSVLLYSKEQLDERGIRQVIEKITIHHDALRMVFDQHDSVWIQENKGEQYKSFFEVVYPGDEQQFKVYCDALQAGMDLKNGPLFKTALLKTPDGDYLLLIAHHLVIDGVSWRIIFDDIAMLYEQYCVQEPLTLPLKTDSFSYWQQQQLAYMSSDRIREEEAYWSALEAKAVPSLQPEWEGGGNLVADTARCAFTLDKETTERLLTKCYQAYRTDINDILMTGLGLALKETLKLDNMLVSVEGHGRENIIADVDVTRTVGWFTTTYPVWIDLSSHHNEELLIAVKETLHRVPNKGIGYGILRYLGRRNYCLQPDILFNYLGEFAPAGEKEGAGGAFEFSGRYHGKEYADATPRSSLLNVFGMIVENRLKLVIEYSNKQYSTARMQRLTDTFEAQLHQLINRLAGETKKFITPADLTYKDLPVQKVKEIDGQYGIEDIYPLSPLQEGLYFHAISAAGSPAYFEQTGYSLKGRLETDVLKKSYQMLIKRHSVLRTFFTGELSPPQVFQVVVKEPSCQFVIKDISVDPFASIEKFRREDRQLGFDLHIPSQMRLTILVTGADTCELIWSHHHILMDGWCSSILISEFFQIYYSLLEGSEPVLDKVSPYSAYIRWLTAFNRDEAMDYWRTYLEGYQTKSSLPAESRLKKAAYRMAERHFVLKETLHDKVKALCMDAGVTVNAFFQAVWAMMLGYYNQQEDVVFGAVVSGRPAGLEGVEQMIGLFANTVPVRIQPLRDLSFTGLLKQVQQNAIAGIPYHYVQLADIQAQSELKRDLFDHLVIFENYPVREVTRQGIENNLRQPVLELAGSTSFKQTHYDFTVNVSVAKDFVIEFNYNGNVYTDNDVHNLQTLLLRVIEWAVQYPEEPVGSMNMVTEEEQRRLLTMSHGQTLSCPADATLVSLFRQQAARTPAAPALFTGRKTVSYAELDRQSARLAVHLRNHYGVQPGDCVGMMLSRDDEAVLAILAILKAGAAYVPLEPAYPAARKEYILKDAGITVLLTQVAFMFDVPGFQGVMLAMDVETSYRDLPELQEQPPVAAEALAYVIYTSGSTGQPKGVMVEHRAVVNTILAQQVLFGAEPDQRHLQFASLSFDASVSEIFVALCSGSCLYIVPDEVKMSTVLMEAYLKEYTPELATLPPAYVKLLDEEALWSLKRLVTAGEAADAGVALSFGRRGIYYNAYGPTETAICGTVFKLEDGQGDLASVSIGRPVFNARVYILDYAGRLARPGIEGEICIGGAGLARGYLNQPELTATRFVPDPFEPGARMYRTGDRGRWQEDGNIIFLGRMDEQIKVRGYRVEPGEVEEILQRFGPIKAVAVVPVKGNSGETELVAYVCPAAPLEVAALHAFLREQLPAYMIPSQFIQLDALPLTTSGKTDRKKLADSQVGRLLEQSGYIAPQNETETTLVKIWQDILGHHRIGIMDNFFEIGGHSLTAIKIITQVYREMTVRIEVGELFDCPTIQAMARIIDRKEWAKNSTQHYTGDVSDTGSGREYIL